MATLFTIAMTGSQETPPNGSPASGAGIVHWDPETSTASYEIVVRGLDFGPVRGLPADTAITADDVTNMHVHEAARGVAGPVIFGQITPAQDNDDLSVVRLETMDVTQGPDGAWIISGAWDPADPAGKSITAFADALNAAASGDDLPLYFNTHTTTFPAGEIRGQWVGASLDDGAAPVDWNTIAAVVQANFAQTGSWFL
ncbi:CHRD domain-containing protein [Falsiroseomonas sp. HW251]|uniref:CHRD domain-containing protein n=1 Tax=Falsiroseomonas sp. HW251 TaxID=3390998 RepID=UPI003D31402B